MKQEVKDNIQTNIAENVQDVNVLISDLNFLVRTGCLDAMFVTRNAETSDYIEMHVKFKPEQNWIK